MYVPLPDTIEFMMWQKRYLTSLSNKSAISHYKLIDYYGSIEKDDIGLSKVHRGWGKTEWNARYALWLICSGREDYILFVGGTQDLTNDIISSLSEMLDDVAIPGISVKRSVEGILELNRENGNVGYLVAKSVNSKLRGVAKGKKRTRPTMIVLDDIVDDEMALNRIRMFRALKWLTSALFPTLVPGGKTIGAGTPIHDADPYMRLCKEFGAYEIPLTEESFPDRFTKGYIERKRRAYTKLGRETDWLREFELKLVDDENSLFDLSKVDIMSMDDFALIEGKLTFALACDLAISQQSGADYSAFTVIGIDEVGRRYVLPYRERLKPSESAYKILELQSRYAIDNVGVESGATYDAMIEHLDKLMMEYQSFFSVEPLSHGGINKHSRIKILEPIVSTGMLTVIDTGEGSEDLLEQMRLTDNVSINAQHDDVIDATAYAARMANSISISYLGDDDD